MLLKYFFFLNVGLPKSQKPTSFWVRLCAAQGAGESRRSKGEVLVVQQCWGSFPKISAPWVDIINLLLRITAHQQQLNLLLQALKPPGPTFPAEMEPLWGDHCWEVLFVVALVSPQLSMCCVLLLTNPPYRTRDQKIPFSMDFPLLLGRRDIWLILQWRERFHKP